MGSVPSFWFLRGRFLWCFLGWAVVDGDLSMALSFKASASLNLAASSNWENTDTVRRGTSLCRIGSTLFRIFSSLSEYLFLEGEAGEDFVVRDREGGWIRLYAPGRGTE